MAERKNAGLCVQCGQPAKEGLTRCIKHNEMFKQYMRDRRAKRKTAGLCVRGGCSEPGRSGTTLCEAHYQEAYREVKARRERYLAAGLCVVCGESRGSNASLCEKHKEAKAKKQKAEYERKVKKHKTEGLCLQCVTAPTVEGKAYCSACLRRHCDRQRDRAFKLYPGQYDLLHANQKGACAICRNLCATGKRLSVDHVNLPDGSLFVRGLLCVRCNTSVGSTRDEIDRLKAAVAYLEDAYRKIDGL